MTKPVRKSKSLGAEKDKRIRGASVWEPATFYTNWPEPVPSARGTHRTILDDGSSVRDDFFSMDE